MKRLRIGRLGTVHENLRARDRNERPRPLSLDEDLAPNFRHLVAIGVVVGRHPARPALRELAHVVREATLALNARLRFEMREQRCGLVHDAQAARPDAVTIIDVFVAVPERFVEPAEIEEEVARRRKARARDGVEFEPALDAGQIGTRAPEEMIRQQAFGTESVRKRNHTGVLDRAVRKEQLRTGDPDRRIRERREQMREPPVRRDGVVVEMDDDATLRGTRALIARRGESEVPLVADHAHPRELRKHRGGGGIRAVVDDDRFARSGTRERGRQGCQALARQVFAIEHRDDDRIIHARYEFGAARGNPVVNAPVLPAFRLAA